MNTTIQPEKLTQFADVAWAWAVTFVPQFLIAIAIFLVGTAIARWMSGVIRRMALRTGRVDPTVVPVLGTAVQYGVMILVIVAALGQVGVQTASLLAVLGAAGLAIGLALQGTLTNIAAGIMLLWLRPFRIGDFIEVNGMTGTVTQTGLFSCELETADGVYLFAPNSAIWNNALRNHSRNGGRAVSFALALHNDVDLDRVRALFVKLAASDERILKQPPPGLGSQPHGDDGLLVQFRAWAAQENVASARQSMMDALCRELDAAAIPYRVPATSNLPPHHYAGFSSTPPV